MVEGRVPVVSFCVNSYNRLPLLRNLLRSFELCNEEAQVEWIITDYGSTDGSRAFIEEYARRSTVPVKPILGDEQDYFNELRDRGIAIDSRWARFRAILGKYRNETRAAASGEYFFDVAEDHQFIRRGRWVDEIREIYRHREAAANRDDIAGIVPYGYLRVRLDKPNNALGGEQQASDSAHYFVAEDKTYVDYTLMKRVTHERVGAFFDPLQLVPDSPEMAMWEAQNDGIQPEAEYERRCRRLGLRRVFMKYPITVAFPNDISVSAERGAGKPLGEVWTLDDMKKRFGHLARPISSDELLGRAFDSPLRRTLSRVRVALGYG